MTPDNWTNIIIAVLGFLGCVAGSYFANKKTMALLEYRLQQLENKVQAHNNLVERMYKVEEQTALQDAELDRVNHRLKELEEK